MTSTQKRLGILLAVQVVLILLFQFPFGSGSSATTATTLFPDIDVAQVSRIQLSGDDDQVTLIRGGDGWGLEEFGGFPANETKIDELIGDLAGLEVRRPVVRSGKYHSAFKVESDENEGRVKLWTSDDGDPAADLIVGSSPNYRALHVRRPGDSEVYEVSGLAAYDVRADPGAWADNKLLDVNTDAVQSLSITNPEGSFELVKDESGWTVSGAAETELDTSKVDSLVRSVANLSIAAPLGPSSEHGPVAADAIAKVTLRWSAGGEETPEGAAVVLIGGKRPDDDMRRAVSVEGSGFSGEIWDSTVKSMIEKKLDDLTLQNDA